jgi:hypothetical protein
LDVLLPHNRNHPGWIRIEIDGIPIREFRVLGRGSTHVPHHRPNPTLSPFLYGGNTPTGEYVSPGIESTAKKSQSSYGPWGAVRLKAVAGQALLAEAVFGRRGLLIHGGSPGRFDGYKPTHGCLRLHNDDMKELIRIITGAHDNAEARMCEAVSIRVTVGE